jgi:hypothetical protein
MQAKMMVMIQLEEEHGTSLTTSGMCPVILQRRILQ